jgi:hypothetical protein
MLMSWLSVRRSFTHRGTSDFFSVMSGKAAKRGRFFGRRQRRPVERAERPVEEEELPNPMRRDDWVRWN